MHASKIARRAVEAKTDESVADYGRKKEENDDIS